jgi:hypothetical protein
MSRDTQTAARVVVLVAELVAKGVDAAALQVLPTPVNVDAFRGRWGARGGNISSTGTVSPSADGGGGSWTDHCSGWRLSAPPPCSRSNHHAGADI